MKLRKAINGAVMAATIITMSGLVTACGGEEKEEATEIAESHTMKRLRGMAEKPIPEPREKNRRLTDARLHVNHVGPFREVFNDSNKYQYAFAERYGITPIHDLNGAYNTGRPVVKLEENRFYTLAPLTHSVPYLVPEAEMLLRVVGRNFIDSLGRRGGRGYRIIATSMLRTAQSVKRLRRVNVNATDSSCHKFGTTFDISHTRFDNTDSSCTIYDGTLKGILAEVLMDLRKTGMCMVKYEHKTGCFHITVTPRE